MAAERLQKIIAAAGITSRRKAEELITQGRVTINGQTVTELGSKADPEHDHIKVDGKLLRGAERHIYLLLNKPKGYVTTVSDPQGRPTVMELVKHVGERIYPVGRLDYASEGLLLLTNDGELANYLTRAASHVPKTYLVKVAGTPSEEELDKLRHGVRIGSKPGARGMHAVRTAPAQIKIVREAENPWYEVTLIEGKHRQIRRMFEEIGHHVEKIKRVRYGPLELNVEPGQFRELTAKEVAALRRAGAERPARRIEPREFKTGARFLGKARSERRGQERPKTAERPERSRPRGERQERGRDEKRPRFGGERRERGRDEERPRFSGERRERGRDEERPRFGGERRERGRDEERSRFSGERRERGRDEERSRFSGERRERGGSERPQRVDRGPRSARFERSGGRKRTQHERRGPR